ncbi:hypothetical protein GWK47_031242 [Chionoecetes opilio]|uniref:Uncharacterized protein n=1 Tax=Chionoecetes opilio TaxID=41210 RepID=A0A8J5D199_CHIOP|nr:hypothetical protein GWK47_031242 [Chionoecetes opilio]
MFLFSDVCCQVILRNIVSRDEASVMADALCVVDSYHHLSHTDAYFFRAVHLLASRDVDGAKALLLGLSEAVQKQLCHMLTLYMTQTLLQRPLGDKGRELHRAVTEGVAGLEEVLRKWSPAGSPAEGRDIFSAAHSLHALQSHYGLYPTLRQMEDRMACKRLLQDQVTKWYKENVCDFDAKQHLPSQAEEDKNMKRKSLFRVDVPAPAPAPAATPASKGGVGAGMSRLQWLASLLGVARADLLSHLATLASRSSRLEEAIHYCQ